MNSAELHRKRGHWYFRTATPNRYIWGAGSRLDLVGIVAERDFRRIVVLASRTVWQTSTWAQDFIALLGGRVAGVRFDSEAHTPDWLVLDAADWARELQPDLVLTLGGGSVADWGKAVRFFLAQDIRGTGELDAFVASRAKQHLEVLAADPIPQFCVPTTLSASESTWSVTITRPERAFKDHVRHVSLVPEIVVFDAEVTLETPASLWFASGVKAVEHAVEKGYTNDGNIAVDHLATEAFGLLFKGLLETRNNPTALGPRTDCQLAMMMTILDGRGVHKGLCQVVGWQLGAYGVGHGETAAVMLPHVMEFNSGHDGGHFARLASSFPELNLAAADLVRYLVNRLNLPSTLKDVGVHSESFGDIAEKVFRSPNIVFNPRNVVSVDEIVRVLERARG